MKTQSRIQYAEVVKLVDTLASGASGGNPVEVQVLSSAPFFQTIPDNRQPHVILFFQGFQGTFNLLNIV